VSANPKRDNGKPSAPKNVTKCHETNETSAEISLKSRATYPDIASDVASLSAWEDDVGTFLFLALSSAFLLGMVAGALTRRITD
jgi:hypothetical protein